MSGAEMLCVVCRKNPLPDNWAVVMWCDQCIDEYDASKESVQEFVLRKRKAS